MCVRTFQPGNQKLPLRLGKGTSSGTQVIELGPDPAVCPPIGLSSTLTVAKLGPGGG